MVSIIFFWKYKKKFTLHHPKISFYFTSTYIGSKSSLKLSKEKKIWMDHINLKMKIIWRMTVVGKKEGKFCFNRWLLRQRYFSSVFLPSLPMSWIWKLFLLCLLFSSLSVPSFSLFIHVMLCRIKFYYDIIELSIWTQLDMTCGEKENYSNCEN